MLVQHEFVTVRKTGLASQEEPRGTTVSLFPAKDRRSARITYLSDGHALAEPNAVEAQVVSPPRSPRREEAVEDVGDGRPDPR